MASFFGAVGGRLQWGMEVEDKDREDDILRVGSYIIPIGSWNFTSLTILLVESRNFT